MKIPTKRLHLWCPNIYEFKGGIQVYSNFLLETLHSLYPDVSYSIFLKHDAHVPEEKSSRKNFQFHCAGGFPQSLRTPAFAAQVLSGGFWRKPSLVISTHVNFTIAAYWLKRFTGIPYWAVAHGVDAWDIRDPALQKALHHADQIFSVGEYTRNRLLQEQKLDPSKMKILPCMIDANSFQIKQKPLYLLERYGLRADQPTILTVGRLSKSEGYKGYDKILEALPQIRQAIPDIHYVLIGKGSDRPRVEQIISELQLQDCVTITGYVPDAEIADHYNLCDVFAMPSKGEGFGIVYLEALACGKPTLGGNQDGAVDALCHGKLGALVNPNSVEEIAQALTQILQGTYPNALMYQPEALRQEVINIYGLQAFKQKLEGYLNQHFLVAQR
jgi:glycosyltransferase involved in cell wall biosynthesis